MCESVQQKLGHTIVQVPPRVSVQGVESLWGDCRFIPADWGSWQQICAILLFLKTFHYKNDKKCKSISIFFLKNNNIFFYFIKFRHKHAKWLPSDLTPWTLTLAQMHLNLIISFTVVVTVELVSKELNHLAAILHVYAGGLNFMK